MTEVKTLMKYFAAVSGMLLLLFTQWLPVSMAALDDADLLLSHRSPLLQASAKKLDDGSLARPHAVDAKHLVR